MTFSFVILCFFLLDNCFLMVYTIDKSKKGGSKMFLSTRRKGFQMTFKNGLTVSVQWGAGNYCENHCPVDMDFSFSKDAKSEDAEIAIIYKGEFLNPQYFIEKEISGDGMVSGYLTSEEVAELIYNASIMEENTFLPWYKEAKENNPFNN